MSPLQASAIPLGQTNGPLVLTENPVFPVIEQQRRAQSAHHSIAAYGFAIHSGKAPVPGRFRCEGQTMAV